MLSQIHGGGRWRASLPKIPSCNSLPVYEVEGAPTQSTTPSTTPSTASSTAPSRAPSTAPSTAPSPALSEAKAAPVKVETTAAPQKPAEAPKHVSCDVS